MCRLNRWVRGLKRWTPLLSASRTIVLWRATNRTIERTDAERLVTLQRVQPPSLSEWGERNAQFRRALVADARRCALEVGRTFAFEARSTHVSLDSGFVAFSSHRPISLCTHHRVVLPYPVRIPGSSAGSLTLRACTKLARTPCPSGLWRSRCACSGTTERSTRCLGT